MATIPLWKRSPGTCNRYAVFPDDFHVVGETIIDDEYLDHPEIGGARWFMRKPARSRMAYPVHTGPDNTGCVCLHQVLWRLVHGEPEPGMEIDHINRNSLDNRLENLRLATRAQQSRNRDLQSNCKSGYKGVDGSRQANGNWPAYIYFEKRKRGLGTYAVREEAAYAYNVAMERIGDRFALLNVIPSGTVSPERAEAIRRDVLRRFEPATC